MKKNNTALKTALLTSGSFAGYNIGSGFATGIEGQQFFASWGNQFAFVGLFIAVITTALIFIPVYLIGFMKKSDENYNVFHYYCGQKIGTAIDWYMYISILIVILTMMSGAGATINQYFGIPEISGTILLGVLCIAAALLGLERLVRVLSYASVLIIAFVLGCALYIRFILGVSLSIPTETIEAYVISGELKRISILGISNPIFCGMASAGLLAVASLPWVASTGSLCENKSTAVLSGVLSGVIFYAAQGIVVYLNLTSIDKIAGAEVPILAVFQNYLPMLALVYSGIIIVAIFSTVSGRLFLFASRYDKGNRKRHIAISVTIVVLAALGGTFISFSLISNILFTVNGCLGILLGAVVIIRTILTKSKLPADLAPEKWPRN